MRIALILLLITGSLASRANVAAIAIESDKPAQIMVYLNGTLYSKHPVNFVHINSMPGLFHVEVRVLNPMDRRWYILRKDITVERGYEFYYKVVFDKRDRPALIMINRYPVYNRYFIKPDMYGRNPVS